MVAKSTGSSTSSSFVAAVPGGLPALVLFALSLASYVAQTELAQYVQSTKGYQKPYLMLYFAHSSFVLLLPLHLLYLRYASPLVSSSSAKPSKVPSTRSQLRALRAAIHNQLVHGSHAGVLSLSAKTTLRRDEDGEPFPWIKAFGALTLVTALLTLPAGLWYAAVPLTSMTSITSIYNTSAVFAYIFSVLLLGERWRARKLVAVALATLGVMVVAWGGSAGKGGDEIEDGWLGNGLALLGAVAYGFYEVYYNKHFSLTTTSLPFALHANALTSLIGVVTFVLLAIPIPILDFLGWEKFELPPDGQTTAAIVAVALLGIGFNGSFMVLLGLFGPLVASVGNLLTIVLVALVDSFVSTAHPLNATVFLGGALVCAAFAVLVWDMACDEARKRRLKDEEESRAGGPAKDGEDEEASLMGGPLDNDVGH